MLIVILLAPSVQAAGTLSRTDALKYHRLINEAELALCSGKYHSALTMYGTAAHIRSLEKMGSADLYNYFITAFDLDKQDIAQQVLKPLIARGWIRDTFLKSMGRFYDSTQLIRLAALYDAVGPQALVLDIAYRKLIDSIVNVDRSENVAIRSRDSGYMRNEGLRNYEQITVRNTAALKDLFLKRVPSDYVVGRFGDNEPTERVPYEIVLLHNAQMRTFADNWTENAALYDALYKGVCSAEYDPDEFFSFVSSPFATNKDSVVRDLGSVQLTLPLSNIDFIAIGDSLFEFKSALNNRLEYDRRRALVPGLCDLASYRRKMIFQFYNKKYRFISAPAINRWPSLPKSFRDSLRYCDPKM